MDCCRVNFGHSSECSGLFEVGVAFPYKELDSETDITFARVFTAVKLVVNSLEH